MYGLRDGIDLTFFQGRRLDQVCIGLYQTQLHFDEGVSVAVESEFSLDGRSYVPREGHVCHSLLGLSIKEARKVGLGDVGLDFPSHVLLIRDSNPDYESYTINNGSDLIVV